MKYVRILAILCCLLCLCSVCCFADDSDLEVSERAEITETKVNIESLRISPSDTSGFHAVILGLLGDYNPIVKDYTYTSTQGYTSHSIDIQPDWSWIATAFIFVVVIYCMFRLFGLALGGLK